MKPHTLCTILHSTATHEDVVTEAGPNPETLQTMVHITATHEDMVSRFAVNPYSFWNMVHITTAHQGMVSRAAVNSYTLYTVKCLSSLASHGCPEPATCRPELHRTLAHPSLLHCTARDT